MLVAFQYEYIQPLMLHQAQMGSCLDGARGPYEFNFET